ncbi:MAG: response regulator [Acidobacteriota bacterium]
MTRPSILIADDAATVRMLVELELRPLLPGYGFRQADNGFRALEQIAKEPPALLLLDVAMPVLDGSAVLLVIKHALEFTSLRTGPDAIDESARALASGQALHGLSEAYASDLDYGPGRMKLGEIPPPIAWAILSRPEIQRLPVVMLTSFAEEANQRRLAQMGPPDAMLTKPFDPGHAARVIKELIGRAGS